MMTRRHDMGAKGMWSSRMLMAVIATLGLASPAAGSARATAAASSGTERAGAPVDPLYMDTKDRKLKAALVSQKFVRCMLARPRLRQEIETEVMKLNEDRGLHQLIQKRLVETCLLSGKMKIPDATLRLVIFTELYKIDYSKYSPKLGRINTSYLQNLGLAPGPLQRRSAALRQFASCVINIDQPAVRQLILAEPGSAEAATQKRALAPAFGTCIGTENRVKFSDLMLVGALAEVMYRETRKGAVISSHQSGTIADA